MTQQLTHWKKNNDSRYISGEDLQFSLHGLRPEMPVVIESFTDASTFNAKSQSEETKTGLLLKELNGKKLYKPVILNATNAKFFTGLTGSPFIENWLNIPVVLYACPHKVHGFVARFKKYYAPNKQSDVQALKILDLCASLEELQKAWIGLDKNERLLPTVMAKKEQLKEQFEKGGQNESV